jgi:DNA repair exonuclease SbcCD ATPase subunit
MSRQPSFAVLLASVADPIQVQSIERSMQTYGHPSLSPSHDSPTDSGQPSARQRETLKKNFETIKRDTTELAELAKSLQEDVNKSNENLVSADLVDKAKRIEKLAKEIRKCGAAM